MPDPHVRSPFVLPRAMVVAAAISAAWLGTGTGASAQAGKAPFGGSSFGRTEEAEVTDGNEVVDVRATWLPVIPGRAMPGFALTFTIEPGWHLYWKNSGDTGMPIMLKLDLPAGVEAGEILWPTPKRYIHSGTLLDYTYEDEVTLLVPLAGMSDATGAAPIALGRASIEFLVCQEACIPGERTIDLAVPGGTEAGDASFAPNARLSLARLPGPAGENAEWAWEGTTLVLTAKAPDVASVLFFPEGGRHARPANPIRDGEARGNVIRFEYRDAVRNADTVRGVLEVRNTSGASTFYQVEAPAPK
jgi:DsbC/DsbD-like thiol-disulfide interchange protein